MCHWWHPWKDNSLPIERFWDDSLIHLLTVQLKNHFWIDSIDCYSIAEKQKNPISKGHIQGVITAFPFNCLYLERPSSKHLVLWNPLQKHRLKQDLGYLLEKGILVWRPVIGSQSQCSLLLREAEKTQEEHWVCICILDNTLWRKGEEKGSTNRCIITISKCSTSVNSTSYTIFDTMHES